MTAVLAYGSQQNFQRIPVLGLVPEQGSSAPSGAIDGQLWFDTSLSPPRLKIRENGSFVLLSNSNIVNADIAAGAAIALSKLAVDPLARANHTGTQSADTLTDGTTNKAFLATERTKLTGIATGATANSSDATLLARANHTGTQLAATVSDFDTQVRTSRLDQMAAPSASVSLNTQKITNLAAPTAANDAARLTDVQAAQAGIDNKPSVRAASTANVVIASALENGDVIDGVTLATGDRVLLKNQSSATENGIYVAVASGAASRSTDTLTANTFVFVEEGTANADTQWMISTNGTITIGATSITWAQFGAPGSITAGAGLTLTGSTVDVVALDGSITVAADTITVGLVPIAKGGTGQTTAAAALTALGGVAKYSQDMTAITAGVEQTVTHNLGTKDIHVEFRTNADDNVLRLAWRCTSTNAIAVQGDINFSNAAVRVVVFG